MIRIEPDGDRYAIRASAYNRILYQVCKTTPGMRWEGNAWRGYPDAIEVVQRRCAQYKTTVAGTIPPPETPKFSPFNPSLAGLYEYQRDSIRFTLAHADEGCLLGLDPGLGKTLVALRFFRAIAKYTSKGRPTSFVVVCPAFVTGTWQDEAVKWKWKGDVVVLKGTKVDPKTKLTPQRHTIYVANASMVHAWVDLLLATNPVAMAIDEIHMYQGDAEKSRRTAAVLALRAQCAYAIGLTGTPDPNRIKSLYPIFNILSPGRFGPNIYDFGRRYCNGQREEVAPGKVVWKFEGVSNEEELKRRLEYCLFRRTKAEVAAELPPLTRQITPIDVGKSKRKVKGLIVNGKVNKKALRSELAMAGIAKIPAVVEMVEADVKAGSSVVVGTYRRAVAEEIGAKLAHLDAIVVHGELTPERRKKLIATQPKVLVATIDSVGVGINTLTYASVGIVAEMTYEPWELAQFEGRFHRHGQHSPVLIRYPIARGSIDEHVRDVVLTKMKLSEKPIGVAGDKMVDDFGATVSVDKVLDDLCERLMKEDE